LLDVLSTYEVFSQLKIKVNAETGVIKVAEYKYAGGKRLASSYPIVLTAIVPLYYYQFHPQFTVSGMIFGNPMMIMVIFSVAVIVFFPMMMSGLTEEELKEIQSKNNNPLKEFQSLLGIKKTETEE
jgi:hypothetical protein